jgi:predicted anti-sigma-YlaC factor YlaD
MINNGTLPGDVTMRSYESTTTRLQHDVQLCALVQDLLPLYVEGEVTTSSRDAITGHLSQCERCAAFLAGAQSVRAQLRRGNAEATRALAADQPAQQAMQTYRRIAQVGLALVLLPVGLVIAGELWSSLGWHTRPLASIGALIAFLGLVLGFARRSRLSTAGIITFGIASFAGSLGLVTLMGGAVEAPYFFSAIAFIVGSLAMIWSVAARASST